MMLPVRLTEARNETLGILNASSDDALNYHAAPDTWSIAQILEHLALMDRFIATLIQKGVSESDSYTEQPVPLHKVTDRSYKVQAPKPLEPANEYRTRAELHQSLNDAREALSNVVTAISDANLLKQRSSKIRHIAFGQMSLDQWLNIVGEHEFRHLEQIHEVIETVPNAAAE